MAASTSFKQQCPSCEAMVPIRDAGLIGRKIDCPKCKYRFVVEEPAVEEDDDAPAKKPDAKNGKSKPAAGPTAKAAPKRRGADDDDDEGESRPKKKAASGGGSNMLIIGGVLAAVAVVAIGVGLFAFMGGDSPKPSTPSGSASNNTPAPESQPTPAPTEPEKPATPATMYANATNLLPNDTQAVVSYPLSVSFGSALKAAGIDEAEGGFKVDRFREQFGFAPDEVHRLVTGMSNKEKWLFTVLQTKKPYKKEALAKGLRLQAQPAVKSKTNATHDVFLVQGDLDGMGNLLVKFNLPNDQLHLHFYDSTTLVFADAKPMKKFLEDNRTPARLSKDAPPPAAGAGGGAGGPEGAMGGMGGMRPMTPSAGGAPGGMQPMTPSAGGGGGMGPGGMGGMGPGGMGGMMMGGMGGQPAAGAPTEAPAEASWLTVDPTLKLLLDRVEKLEESKVTKQKEPVSVMTVAELKTGDPGPLTQAIELQGKQERPIAPEFATKVLVNIVKKAKALAASLVSFDQKSATLALAVEYTSNRDAADMEKLVQPILPLLQPIIKDGLGLEIRVIGGGTQGSQQTTGAPTAMGPGAGGMMAAMMGSMRPGGAGGPGMMMPGTGGGTGMMTPGTGSGRPGGSRPGGTDIGEGVMGGAGGAPGVGGGAGGTGGASEEASDGAVSVRQEATTVVFQMDLALRNDAYAHLLEPAKEGMQWLKAQSELSATGTRYHELAKALKAYLEEKGHYPPGAMPRSPSTERGLPWRPDQRLSWAAALVPYFGEDIREWKIDPQQSWDEGKNLLVAGRIVPALVLPRNPETGATVISYSTAGNKTVATTHFVGISGLGLDAAEYKLDDAATEKKVGMFGYDRIVKKTDIKDGAKYTIAFLMVRGEHKAPWLAGGGATVRSVSDEPEDTRPNAPYICCYYPAKASDPTKFDGKRGTIAVMADGAVRFIPEDVPAEMFRALCTIAGGETIDRLDSVCPVIDEPEKRELKTTVTAAALTPAPKLTWKEFSPPTKAFTVKFPGDAQEATQEVPLPGGVKLTVTAYYVKLGADNNGCHVKYLELPAAPPDVDAFFQQQTAQITNGLAALAGAKVKEEKKITLGAHPGREWTIEVPDKGIQKTRVYVVGQKVYELTAGLSSAIPEADMATFFDSFKVEG